MATLRIGTLVAERNSKVQGNVEISKMAGGIGAKMPIVLLNGKNDGPVVNVHAGIHGDEFEGIRAIWNVVNSIDPKNLSGAIIATPIVHMAAYSAGTRESPLDGKNLARLFPGTASGTVTDRLAKFFFDEVVMKSDYTFGLHSGGYKYKFHPMVEYYYGTKREVEEKALAASKAFAIGPFSIIQRLPTPPVNVTCTSEASRNGIPGIEPEMWGEGKCLLQHVDEYAASVMNTLGYLGMTENNSKNKTGNKEDSRATFVEGAWLLANTGGLFQSMVNIRDNVEKDQLIAVIMDDSGKVIEEIRSPRSGFVAVMRSFAMIRPGDWAFLIDWPGHD